uniref:Uncharacterized protein n=1 Tax=Physcomitrium patens TaxID=3218 RepID=A0A2K1JC62_PHYPA|nr:hypothetical protein PHYPA_019385 [Physcomitrium patens]
MDGWMKGWMDERVDGRMDGWMDERVDGWIDGSRQGPVVSEEVGMYVRPWEY